MKLSRSFITKFSSSNRFVSLVFFALTSILQPSSVCLAMGPNNHCSASLALPDRRQCDIGQAFVPMNPSPSFRTDFGAPVIVLLQGKAANLKQPGEAPTAKRPCGSAPVTKTTGNSYSVGQARNLAPHFPPNLCPKAPIIIPSPSKPAMENCK